MRCQSKKGSLMEALAPIEQWLRITSHGGVLLRKLRFEHWRRHPESWQRATKGAHDEGRVADILADEPLPLEAAPKAAAGGFEEVPPISAARRGAPLEEGEGGA